MHGPQETSAGTYRQANNDEGSDLPQSSAPSSLPVWWMSTEEMETCGARKAGTLDRAHYLWSFSTAAGVCSKHVSYLPRLLGFRWICFWICETICCSRVLRRDWQQHCEVNFLMFLSRRQAWLVRCCHIRWPDFQCVSPVHCVYKQKSDGMLKCGRKHESATVWGGGPQVWSDRVMDSRERTLTTNNKMQNISLLMSKVVHPIKLYGILPHIHLSFGRSYSQIRLMSTWMAGVMSSLLKTMFTRQQYTKHFQKLAL